MDIEQLEMDLGIPENEIEDAALDLDYNPEEPEEDDLDFIDEEIVDDSSTLPAFMQGDL